MMPLLAINMGLSPLGLPSGNQLLGHGVLHPVHVPLLFLPTLGMGELAIIFVIILLLFGPGKLPDVCKALGTGFRQFRDATKDPVAEIKAELTNEPKPQLTNTPSEEPVKPV
jgi:sec-independent protein translocase protein TatA